MPNETAEIIGQPGEPIINRCIRAVMAAADLGHPIDVEINGRTVTVSPDDSIDELQRSIAASDPCGQ